MAKLTRWRRCTRTSLSRVFISCDLRAPSLKLLKSSRCDDLFFWTGITKGHFPQLKHSPKFQAQVKDIFHYPCTAGLHTPSPYYTYQMTHPHPCSCRFITFRWLVMLHRNSMSQISVVSFPLLLSIHRQISCRFKHLRSTFPEVSHYTSVWWGKSPCSVSNAPRNALNWWWFKPFIQMKLTARVMLRLTCFICKVLPHNDSWCIMQR